MRDQLHKVLKSIKERSGMWWLRFWKWPSLLGECYLEIGQLDSDLSMVREQFRTEQSRCETLQKLANESRELASSAITRASTEKSLSQHLSEELGNAKAQLLKSSEAVGELESRVARMEMESERLKAELARYQADLTRSGLELEREKRGQQDARRDLTLLREFVHRTHRLDIPTRRGIKALLANGKRLSLFFTLLLPLCLFSQFPPPFFRGVYTTNTAAWANTNVISLSTTNATSKPLTNHYQDGVLTLFGLEAGANITLSHNGSNIVITGAAGGGDAGGTNARQFGTLTLTNLSGTGAVTNVVSLSTTNATSKPITNHFENGILTLYGIEAGANVTLSMNESNIVIASTGGGAEIFFNANQFLPSATHTNIRAGALLTNIFIHQSNNTSVSLVVSNNPGSTRNILEVYNTNQNGFKITSNGVMQIRGNSSGDAPVLFIENIGANQTYTIWTNGNGGDGSFIMRTDNAGNAVFSPGQVTGETYFGGPDSGSGIVNFNLVTVGSMWRMVPSAAVAAWHGGTLRRGQITNVWDIWGRTNLWLSRTGLFDGIVATNDIRFLGHNSTSNDVWVCTNTVTGEGEWRSYALQNLSDVAAIPSMAGIGHGDVLAFDGDPELWTNAGLDLSQFSFASKSIVLRDGVTVTNPNSIGILHITNKPGVDRAVRFWNTNGLGYSEFGVVTQAWLPTNKFLLSITNPAVGEVLEIQSVSYADGVASIVITNAPDNSGGGGALTTNANQFGASAELTIKSGASLTNMNYFDFGTNHSSLWVEGTLTANTISTCDIFPTTDDSCNLGDSTVRRWQGIFLKTTGANFLETGGGSDFVRLVSPSALAAGYTLILPDAQGADGQTITNNGAGTLGWWTPGGPFGVNANQFASNGNLVSIKSGALLTNTLFYQSNTTGPATISLPTIGAITNLAEWRNSNGVPCVTVNSNSQLSFGRDDIKTAIVFRTNQIDLSLCQWKPFTNSLQTNVVLQITNIQAGVQTTLDIYGAGIMGGTVTNAWQVLFTVGAGNTIFWPVGATNGNFDVLVNSNQVVQVSLWASRKTNVIASYKAFE